MSRLLWLFLGLVLAWPLLPAEAADDATTPVRVDERARTVTVDAKMAPRKLSDPKFQGIIYPIEVIACWPYPRGQKAHETVVTIDCKPSQVHKGLEKLGLKPGKPVKGEGTTRAEGPEVNLFLQFAGPDGAARRLPIERTLVDPKTNKPMPKVKWLFTGSAMTKPSPDKDETAYGADSTGTLISIFPVTDETVFQSNLTMKEEKFLKLEINKTLLPPEGKPVQLVIEAASAK
jgi:hypothetical protein